MIDRRREIDASAAGAAARGRFVDHMVDREHRFSLGLDTKTGRPFLSTPISGRMLAVEFEGYFSITQDEYDRFRADPPSAEPLLELCRMGRADGRRILENVT